MEKTLRALSPRLPEAKDPSVLGPRPILESPVDAFIPELGGLDVSLEHTPLGGVCMVSFPRYGRVSALRAG